jgi:hypothetical protein
MVEAVTKLEARNFDGEEPPFFVDNAERPVSFWCQLPPIPPAIYGFP